MDAIHPKSLVDHDLLMDIFVRLMPALNYMLSAL
jgi:hypothetical protein